MKKHFVMPNSSTIEPNIFANKSSLVLEWLLIFSEEHKRFSIREIAQTLNISIGLVHKVIKVLIFYGGVAEKGENTAKIFYLLNRQAILSTWINAYDIQKKCHIWSYNFGSKGRDELLKVLEKRKYKGRFTLALHSAADALGFRGTNLDTLEIYLLDQTIRDELEIDMQLSPQTNSLQVVLIKPYYNLMLKKVDTRKKSPCSSPLLTFLDLYHYPLRGIEQAEHIVSNYEPLKKTYNTLTKSLW